MKNTIHRLVYYSHNRIVGTPEALATGITSVLDASRRNNPRSGITGAMMFNAGCFAQVIEGPLGAVEHLFERIQQDDRHGDVSVLSFSAVRSRAFQNWAMSFTGNSVADAARFGSIAGDSGYDPSRMSGDAIFEALRRLVLEEEVAAYRTRPQTAASACGRLSR